MSLVTRGLRWAVLLFPIAAALGPYARIPGLGPVYAFRAAGILAGVFLLVGSRSELRVMRPATRPLIALGGIASSWTFATLIWTPDLGLGLNECAAIALGFLVIIAVAEIVLRVTDGVKSLLSGWLLAYAVCGGIAVWELVTGHHLESSFTQTYGNRPDLLRLSTFSSFGNPNNFGAFIVLAFPALCALFYSAKSVAYRLLVAVAIATMLPLLYLSGARLAMAGLVFQVLFLVGYGSVRSGAVRRALVPAGIGLGLLIVAAAPYFRGLILLADIGDLGAEARYGGSTSVRVNMLKNGSEMLVASHGVGTGAGSFSYEIEHGFRLHPVLGTVNPHNLGIEIAAQYGLVGIALVALAVLWLSGLLLKAWIKGRSVPSRSSRAYRLGAALMCCGYIPAASESSAYLAHPVNWMAIATIVGLALGSTRVHDEGTLLKATPKSGNAA